MILGYFLRICQGSDPDLHSIAYTHRACISLTSVSTQAWKRKAASVGSAWGQRIAKLRFEMRSSQRIAGDHL